MNKNRIILARHGQDEDNANGILNGRRDMPLTKKGVAQAYELANNVRHAGLQIGLVISSHLQRAKKTAEICSHELGVTHIVVDFLIERGHGILEGHHYSEIPTLATEYHEAFGFTYVVSGEGVETYPELYQRAFEILPRLAKVISQANIEGDILVVSHAAISKAMLLVHRGIALKDIFETPSIGNCEFRILE